MDRRFSVDDRRHLASRWRAASVVTAMLAPFAATQLAVLALFTVLTVAAVIRFRATAPSAAAAALP